ncbi:hypothetical protein SISNIDRAFT_275776 [Sistotremastrum niveocremeum HHB9708]|uniref:SnoaL-like domain-containing protein n=1 Tax=Sistotremastrum niveocremeum HHB9708 TaxID=1314777 RepID=A0A164NRY2_9AGAM|nr:hypothetical protein SISNIDRAFT_275776 [Sistotremastrum niveocremeum HHB9708]
MATNYSPLPPAYRPSESLELRNFVASFFSALDVPKHRLPYIDFLSENGVIVITSGKERIELKGIAEISEWVTKETSTLVPGVGRRRYIVENIFACPSNEHLAMAHGTLDMTSEGQSDFTWASRMIFDSDLASKGVQKLAFYQIWLVRVIRWLFADF